MNVGIWMNFREAKLSIESQPSIFRRAADADYGAAAEEGRR